MEAKRAHLPDRSFQFRITRDSATRRSGQDRLQTRGRRQYDDVGLNQGWARQNGTDRTQASRHLFVAGVPFG